MFRLSPVAIKTCRITKVTASVVREFMDELKLMAPLSHENLVGLVGGCWSDGPDKLCLVLEFCERGTLKDLLVATATHELNHDWSHPFHLITTGIASCFRYFHHGQPSGEALLHRDLKPENVLISDNFEAKVRFTPSPLLRPSAYPRHEFIVLTHSIVRTALFLQIADLGASRRFDQEEVARRLADHEGASMLSMTMVGTPVRVLLSLSPHRRRRRRRRSTSLHGGHNAYHTSLPHRYGLRRCTLRQRCCPASRTMRRWTSTALPSPSWR